MILHALTYFVILSSFVCFHHTYQFQSSTWNVPAILKRWVRSSTIMLVTVSSNVVQDYVFLVVAFIFLLSSSLQITWLMLVICVVDAHKKRVIDTFVICDEKVRKATWHNKQRKTFSRNTQNRCVENDVKSRAGTENMTPPHSRHEYHELLVGSDAWCMWCSCFIIM